MIVLNFSNVEELVLFNSSLHNELPDLKPLFNQWKLAQRTPGLKTMQQRLVLEFLDQLTDKHILVIEKRIGDQISVEKISWREFTWIQANINTLENELNRQTMEGELFGYREGDLVYIGCWN